MKRCYGADGLPDAQRMRQLIEEHDRTRRLDSIAWGLFFVWVGVAWLAGFDVGIGLLGVSIITLGSQAIRWKLGLRTEGFWILVGVAFGIGGLWELADIEKPIIPVLLVLVGLIILGSMFRHRRP